MDEIISPNLWREIKQEEVRDLLELYRAVVLLEDRGTYHDKAMALYKELSVGEVIKELAPYLKQLDEMEPLVKGRRPYGKVLNTLVFWTGVELRSRGLTVYCERRKMGGYFYKYYSETPFEPEPEPEIERVLDKETSELLAVLGEVEGDDQ